MKDRVHEYMQAVGNIQAPGTGSNLVSDREENKNFCSRTQTASTNGCEEGKMGCENV